MSDLHPDHRDGCSPAVCPALHALADELARLPEDELASINVDVRAAVLRVLGALPSIGPHRAAMVEWFGEEMAAHVDRIEVCARAVSSAHAEHLAAAAGVDLEPLVDAAREARAVLRAEAQSLAMRRLLPREALARVRTSPDHAGLGLDVVQLVLLLRRHWASIEPVTGLRPADLDHAETVAARLADAAVGRAPSTVRAKADARRRAFTLLARSYRQVRRMLAFLRFDEGDADRIAPALNPGRSGRSRAKGATPAEHPREGADQATPSRGNASEPDPTTRTETDDRSNAPKAHPMS